MIQSVAKALAILRCFSLQEPELSVTALAERLAMNKSTVSRLLGTLASEGLVEKDADTGHYRLGLGLIELAGIVMEGIDPRRAAYPQMVEVGRVCQETVNLSVIDGDDVVNIERVSGVSSIAHLGWIGRRTPVHCTAAGKVLLAFGPTTTLEAFLARALPSLTASTIIESGALRRELETVRQRGYATAFGELEPGLSAVAAPVWNHRDTPVAALTVSGPAYRLTHERLSSLSGCVCAAAATVSGKLGCRMRLTVAGHGQAMREAAANLSPGGSAARSATRAGPPAAI